MDTMMEIDELYLQLLPRLLLSHFSLAALAEISTHNFLICIPHTIYLVVGCAPDPPHLLSLKLLPQPGHSSIFLTMEAFRALLQLLPRLLLSHFSLAALAEISTHNFLICIPHTMLPGCGLRTRSTPFAQPQTSPSAWSFQYFSNNGGS
jgi:hypothetical protein